MGLPFCATVVATERRVTRMGPLSLEQKKRAQVKRAKLEKHKEDMRKPQEIREEDITRSENETTKNVTVVSHTPLIIFDFALFVSCRFKRCSWTVAL